MPLKLAHHPISQNKFVFALPKMEEMAVEVLLTEETGVAVRFLKEYHLNCISEGIFDF